MKTLVFLPILFFSFCGIAQNLIPNNSFEQHTACPTGPAQTTFCPGWTLPSNGSPDLFDHCSTSNVVSVPLNYWGYQHPRTGNAYAGMNLIYYVNPDFREYLQVELTSPLIAGKLYDFEVYISKCNQSIFATDDFGVYFTTTSLSPVPNWTVLPVSPQISNTSGQYYTDTLNWVKFSATYLSTAGGEKFLIFGNFKNDQSTTVITTNQNGSQNSSYVYLDDFSLKLSTTTNIGQLTSQPEIQVYLANDLLYITNAPRENCQLSFYDLSGRNLGAYNVTAGNDLDISSLPRGLVFYEILENGECIKKGKLCKE